MKVVKTLYSSNVSIIYLLISRLNHPNFLTNNYSLGDVFNLIENPIDEIIKCFQKKITNIKWGKIRHTFIFSVRRVNPRCRE